MQALPYYIEEMEQRKKELLNESTPTDRRCPRRTFNLGGDPGVQEKAAADYQNIYQEMQSQKQEYLSRLHMSEKYRNRHQSARKTKAGAK